MSRSLAGLRKGGKVGAPSVARRLCDLRHTLGPEPGSASTPHSHWRGIWHATWLCQGKGWRAMPSEGAARGESLIALTERFRTREAYASPSLSSAQREVDRHIAPDAEPASLARRARVDALPREHREEVELPAAGRHGRRYVEAGQVRRFV